MYKTKSVMQIKEDYLNTLDKCINITLEDCKHVKIFNKILTAILRVFAPLM